MTDRTVGGSPVVRAIEVLVDREAVESGAAAAGEPWQHYDLGHGYCAYTFSEQCPHRRARACCNFSTTWILDHRGTPLAVSVTGGNQHHVTQLIPLLDAIPRIRGLGGRPRSKPK